METLPKTLNLPEIFQERPEQSKSFGERMPITDSDVFDGFYDRLQEQLANMEADGYRIHCVILFGSLADAMKTNKSIRVDPANRKILLSDADILVLADRYDSERGQTKWLVFGTYGATVREPFTPRIPNVEIIMRTLSGMKAQLGATRQECLDADIRSPDYKRPFRTDHIAWLQALVEGIIIQGQIPEELYPYIQDAINAVHNCTNFVNPETIRIS